ncbi:MAG: tRNA (N(6)-L-threonylcarbamoyladenosine(37)-C(2))-methylthiotransferase MtaB [Lentisphaeria bacterium]|nr:tRNA (N(6)-L-threonylcarbamoyladenosine(37)-C(2))-methylthiotransferase MtaB [Lentisphaeria bacterium]
MILLTASVVTLGCRLNQADSSLICDRLRKCGFEIVSEDSEESPSLIVVNSCAVTETAAKKTRQTLKQLRHDHPYSYLVFTGCSANLLKKEDGNDNLEYDVLLSSDRKDELESLLARRFNIDKNRLKERAKAKEELENTSPVAEEVFREHAFAFTPFKHRANLKIQDGCNNFCSYCIVPYTRGRERSRDVEEVIADFRNIVASGFREVVLTGVNTCQYECGSLHITDLIGKLLKEVEGDYRIRIGSLEPGERLFELIDYMAEEKRICNFLHVPLQSGSDTILKAMGRKYTADEYRKMALYAKKKIANVHLGCDYITGFPGETKELFKESCDFIRELQFANVHVFPYSPRKGTPAAEMKGRPTAGEMSERIEILKALKAECAAAFAKSLIGTETTVIPERVCAAGIYEGYSSNYMKIRIASKEKDILGDLVKVRLTSISANNPELLGGKLIP